MAISFKNVGVKKNDVRQNIINQNRTLTPIGIKTPLEIDPIGKELFAMNFKIQNQIQDNLKNLLQTNHGERVNFYDFGANLQPLATEYTNKDDFEAEAMLRINTAISKFMSYITPLEFDSNTSRTNREPVAEVKILVTYSVPSLNILKDQVEVMISVI